LISSKTDLSLVIVKLTPGPARFAIVAAAAILLVCAWFSLKWNFVNMLAARSDPTRPEARIISDGLAKTSPSDAAARAAAGAAFERSFDPGDVDRALLEYQAAAAASPDNYVYWLDLARVRSLTGDNAGTLSASARALELAPNYASVQWAYGNTLVRQGRIDEGLKFLAKAAAARAEYSRPAALTALQMLNGDVDAARNALGGNDAVNASLADALAASKRYDEAVGVWGAIPNEARRNSFTKLDEAIRARLVEAKQFRLASLVAAGMWANDDRPTAGRLTNGSFESEVKLRDASLFEWQIADGAAPQIGIAEGQAFAGAKNLFLLFNSFETAAFRPVSQTIAAEPGGEYELRLHYRSDVRSEGQLVIEAAAACELNVLAATPPLAGASEWTPVTLRFTVPANCDGVVIRLNRTGCAGPSCPMHGRLSLDDLSLRQL
jgi:Tfp pilus assembly protein PilF